MARIPISMEQTCFLGGTVPAGFTAGLFRRRRIWKHVPAREDVWGDWDALDVDWVRDHRDV
jgi:hypothetical protein